MENKLNIMELPELPCRRSLNLFELKPIYVVPTDDGFKKTASKTLLRIYLCEYEVDISSVRIVWSILPTNSPRIFYFKSLAAATRFAKSNENYHSGHFWFKLYYDNPLYYLSNVAF